ncbi:protein Son-like isoform X1 [Clavelina lepadiformis]|uniref:protein Son-like isoform X1 n=1 Tax=Clavelina lepadiformis TaxID=159417 RepID=UPI00404378AD
MDDDVDDIFKSFVNHKLKELGLKRGAARPEEKSENKTVDERERNGETIQESECRKKQPKHKHKKEKKKKHKKEKKTKKKKKSKHKDIDSPNGQRVTVPQNGETESKKLALKKKLIVEDDSEVIIKKKKLNCYHDTVSKIKEIEKLSLCVDESENGTKTVTNERKMNNLNDIGNKSEESVVKDVNVSPTNETGAIKKENNDSTATKNVTIESSTDFKTNLGHLSENSIANNVSFNSSTSKVAAVERLGDNSNSAEQNDILPKVDSGNNTSANKLSSAKQSVKEEEKEEKKESRRKRSRSRSQKRKTPRSDHRSRSRSPRKHRRHHHHRSSDSHRRHKSSRRKRSLSPVISTQDKVRLLEIAKANVLAQHKADLNITTLSHESKAVFRSGGITLKQLTGVCQDISEGKREAVEPESVQPSKVHHPFQVKESHPISINIKNMLPPPPMKLKPITELTKEFPVSCGAQHQRKEVLEEVYGKWEPIMKDEEAKQSMKAIVEEKVFPDAPETDNTLAIKDVIAQRVTAVRELQTNPNDFKAMKSIYESQKKLDSWTTSRLIPGRFTGEVGLQPLKKSELVKGQQAWASTETLNAGQQVGGIGKCLLQKMGWKEGESLGKTNVGMLEPLRVNVKTDRKGLSSMMEGPTSTPPVAKTHPVVRDLSGKHPVSALMEICSKRRWKPPDFVLVLNSGPDHSRSFMFKVRVNDTFYQPSVASMNKKLAKSQAATAALQGMGLIPG